MIVAELNVAQQTLLSKSIIEIRGNITQETADYVRECVSVLETVDNPPVRVIITSSGGDIIAGLDIYDMIANYTGMTTGVVIAEASSMAAVILQACKKRLAYANSRILIHDPAILYLSIHTVRTNNSKFQKLLAKNDERIFSRTYRILAKRSGKTIPQVKKVCHKEEEMFADEALRFGLIDSIIKPQLG